MNDTTKLPGTDVPDDLSDMLPVGMLANGGLAAEAMIALANRLHDVPGWGAFHYERNSETSFDITGGMVVMAGASKKWPGPHDTVTVTETQILQEMRDLRNPLQAPVTGPAAAAAVMPINQAVPVIGNSGVSAGTAGTYLNVTFSLPEDDAGRQRILKAFHLQADFFGARVEACSLQKQS